MENTDNVQDKNNDNRSLWIPVIIAFVGANALFFDKGLYDFHWVKSRYAWLAYLVFAGCLFLGQLIAKYTLFRKQKQFSILTCLVGLVIGTGLGLVIYKMRK